MEATALSIINQHRPVRICNTAKMTEDEWRKLRLKYIGGSDSATAVGVNPYKSPIGLWLIKTGQVEDDDLSEVEAVQIGKRIEDFIAQLFTERTGVKIRRDNFMYRHPEHEFMAANVDRVVVGKNEGVEIKNVGIRSAKLWEGDELPDIYYCQCQHYAAVMGWDGVHIAALIAGNKFITKYVPRDDAFIDNLIAAEAAFWQYVTTKTMPPADGSPECGDALKRIYPESTSVTIELPDTAELWIKQYDKAVLDIKEAEARKTEAQNALQQMLGENEAGRIAERLVTWKSTKARETFDGKRFQADYPDIYKQYIKIGEPSRRFSIK